MAAGSEAVSDGRVVVVAEDVAVGSEEEYHIMLCQKPAPFPGADLVSASDPTDAAADGLHHRYASVDYITATDA